MSLTTKPSKEKRKKETSSLDGIRTKSKKPRTYTAFLHASHTPQQ